MENRFYYGLMRLFIATSFVVTTSLTISAQRFETNLVCLSDNGDLARTVKIEPVVKFTIKKDNRYLWAKCEEKKSRTNTTKHNNSRD